MKHKVTFVARLLPSDYQYLSLRGRVILSVNPLNIEDSSIKEALDIDKPYSPRITAAWAAYTTDVCYEGFRKLFGQIKEDKLYKITAEVEYFL